MVGPKYFEGIDVSDSRIALFGILSCTFSGVLSTSMRSCNLQNLVDDNGLYLIKLATDDSSGNTAIAAVPAVSGVTFEMIQDGTKVFLAVQTALSRLHKNNQRT